MQQYIALKAKNTDSLLFYRLGDFYELFYEDAVIASRELGLVLTQRHGIPMCGVPWHAHESYLTKLIQKGHRVAICEQLETPEEAKQKRGYKATVERDVVRVVTQGTTVESSMLADVSNNFLMSISIESADKLGVAYADISTGVFLVESIDKNDLLSTISKIHPSEIICQDSFLSKKELLESIEPYKSIIRAIPSAKFLKDSAEKRLANFFNVRFIDAFGKFSKGCVDAAAAIVEYLFDVYLSENVGLAFPRLINAFQYMQIDSFTRKSLELNRTQNGEKKGSLLHTIDETVTSQGSRLLDSWLAQPLLNIEKINKRLDFVEFFVSNQAACENTRETLKGFPDLERSFSRILMKKAGPRELNCIKTSMQKARELGVVISEFSELKSLNLEFFRINNLIDTLDSAIIETAPVLARDGGFIKKGYDKELDEYLDLLDNGEDVIQKLQKKYACETGISTLKVKNNNVLGYFIEVTPSQISKIPNTFLHRQSLASALRYTTPELSEIANKVYSADSNSKRRELQIFEDLSSLVIKNQSDIRDLANKIAFLDVVSSFAYLAMENNYARPILTEEKILDIHGGRHVVVEKNLKSSGSKFIENDCCIGHHHKPTISEEVLGVTEAQNRQAAPGRLKDLGADLPQLPERGRLLDEELTILSLLTGPNMGGKSTYLRQNAIIVIMAQMGMFVPAKSATIGIADRVFSRVGASDDISSGKSTFMVEMLETASILCQASEKSFIILDEIGRGTSTYDGLSIAWAVAEEICNNIKARTIFATHYHELKGLQETVPNVQFLTVKVEEWHGKIIFLHKIERGFVNKSYGINVAALAGFPDRVLKRAEDILKARNF